MMGRTSEVAVRFLNLMACLLFIASPAFAQSITDTEQELLKIRAKMSQNFVDAVATKDVSLVADHYTKDAVIAGLAPTKWMAVGRDAIVKRYDGLIKAGTLSDYLSTPTEVHMIGDNTAWTTGYYEVTVLNKDGTKQRVQGNWLDMIRREEDGHWRVSFAGYGSMPKQ
jgi:uncharacterized protein (TIGR02246 family)